MNWKILILIVILILSTLLINAEEKKLLIITTIFPLYDFAKEVGGDRADVSIILPPGTEAHSFEPSPGDIISINKADFFIYIGESMEPWAQDILDSLKSKKLTIIEAGYNIVMTESDDDTHQRNIDPHIWLDFEIDQLIIKKIADSFSIRDSNNKDYYQSNADNYINKLKSLDNEYRNTIDKCKIKTILYGGHNVFGYLANRYDLMFISPYEGFSPDAEPKPMDIAKLIKKVRALNSNVIFFEELLEPKIAKVISKETGAGMLILHGAHNISRDELKREVTFLEIMKDNLNNLKKGLKCQ